MMVGFQICIHAASGTHALAALSLSLSLSLFQKHIAPHFFITHSPHDSFHISITYVLTPLFYVLFRGRAQQSHSFVFLVLFLLSHHSTTPHLSTPSRPLFMDVNGSSHDFSPPATPPNFFTTAPPLSPPLARAVLLNTKSSYSGDDDDDDDATPLATCFTNEQQSTITQFKTLFQQLTSQQKQYLLYEIVNCCDSTQLTYLNDVIAPRLKIDFLKELPIEISLYVLSFIEDPKTLARASCVSTFWNSLLKDEATWKLLCMKHQYNRRRNSSISGGELLDPPSHRLNFSYREYFKRKYNIASAWTHGGHVKVVEDGFGDVLVTSLQFDEKYIVVGCHTHRIEVFDTQTARKIRTLEGHEGGVWALHFKGGERHDPERVLVSGACDRYGLYL